MNIDDAKIYARVWIIVNGVRYEGKITAIEEPDIRVAWDDDGEGWYLRTHVALVGKEWEP